MSRILQFPGSFDLTGVEPVGRVLEGLGVREDGTAEDAGNDLDPSTWGIPRAFFVVRAVIGQSQDGTNH